LVIATFLLLFFPVFILALTVIPIHYKTYSYLPFLATTLEIYGVLLVFLSEIFSSNIRKRWANPHLTKGFKFPFTQTNDYILKDEKKYYYTVGFGRFLKQILKQAESYIELPDDIRRNWFWLKNAPNEETCKIEFDISATEVGTNKDLQNQIDEIKEYASTKTFGYFILFVGFIIQMIFNLLSLNFIN